MKEDLHARSTPFLLFFEPLSVMFVAGAGSRALVYDSFSLRRPVDVGRSWRMPACSRGGLAVACTIVHIVIPIFFCGTSDSVSVCVTYLILSYLSMLFLLLLLLLLSPRCPDLGHRRPAARSAAAP